MSASNLKSIDALIAPLKSNPKAVIALAAVVVLLDVGLVLRWQWGMTARVFKEARKINSDIVTTRREARGVTSNRSRADELRQQKESLDKMVIDEEGLQDTLESISKFANTSSVRILRIKPVGDLSVAKVVDKQMPNSVTRQQISISAKAGFHQLGRFVALLESAPVYMDIKNIEIQNDEQEYGKQMITIVLEVLVRKA